MIGHAVLMLDSDFLLYRKHGLPLIVLPLVVLGLKPNRINQSATQGEVDRMRSAQ